MREVARARGTDRPRALLLLGVDRQDGGSRHIDHEEFVLGMMPAPFRRPWLASGSSASRLRSSPSQLAKTWLGLLRTKLPTSIRTDFRVAATLAMPYRVMLREYGLEEAAEFYRQVREAIHERPFDYFGAIGISGGAAELVPNEDAGSLIEAASSALRPRLGRGRRSAVFLNRMIIDRSEHLVCTECSRGERGRERAGGPCSQPMTTRRARAS